MPTRIIRTLHDCSPSHMGGVVTMGNFDGVHLGHQQLLSHVVKKADSLGVRAQVLTFEPQPQEFFSGKVSNVPRLTKMREKYAQFAACGMDDVIIIRFNQWLANLSASDFVRQVLLDGLAPKEIVIGDDFRFGKARQGDFEFLSKAGEEYGFAVHAMPTFMLDGARVSSTRVRQALTSGDMAYAARLLGRPYAMMGKVSHGRKLGRELGCPTANIHVNRRLTPVQGIFTVLVHGVTDTPWPGVASVGTRPTIDGTRTLLEVHLLDFDGNLYGRHVEVAFCHKLRDEERYDNLALLKNQIALDVANARQYFKQ